MPHIGCAYLSTDAVRASIGCPVLCWKTKNRYRWPKTAVQVRMISQRTVHSEGPQLAYGTSSTPLSMFQLAGTVK